MINDVLKKLRLDNNLKQKDVAEGIGVTRALITQYESGMRQPSIEMLKKIADFYDVSVDFILGRTDNPTMSNVVIENTFFRFAKNAREMGIGQKDLDAILHLYKTHQEDNRRAREEEQEQK